MAASGPDLSQQAVTSVTNLNVVQNNQSLPKLVPERQRSYTDHVATVTRASKNRALHSIEDNSGLEKMPADESKDYAEASITSKDKAGPHEAGRQVNGPAARLLESSTEERVALFNEMKMMAHMARKGGLASPTPDSAEPRVTTNPDLIANIEFSFHGGKDTVQLQSGSSKGLERKQVMLSSSPSRFQRRQAHEKTPQHPNAIYFSEDE